MQKDICDVREIADYLNISIAEVRKLVREKKIPFFRLGNRIKFRVNTIDNWLEKLAEKEAKKSLYY